MTVENKELQTLIDSEKVYLAKVFGAIITKHEYRPNVSNYNKFFTSTEFIEFDSIENSRSEDIVPEKGSDIIGVIPVSDVYAVYALIPDHSDELLGYYANDNNAKCWIDWSEQYHIELEKALKGGK